MSLFLESYALLNRENVSQIYHRPCLPDTLPGLLGQALSLLFPISIETARVLVTSTRTFNTRQFVYA